MNASPIFSSEREPPPELGRRATAVVFLVDFLAVLALLVVRLWPVAFLAIRIS
jgi:hypothetical protein